MFAPTRNEVSRRNLLVLIVLIVAVAVTVGLSGCSPSNKDKARKAVIAEHVSGPHTVKLLAGADDADGLEKLHVYCVDLGDDAQLIGLSKISPTGKKEVSGAQRYLQDFVQKAEHADGFNAEAMWKEISQLLNAADTVYLVKDNRAAHTRLYVVGNPSAKKAYFIFARH